MANCMLFENMYCALAACKNDSHQVPITVDALLLPQGSEFLFQLLDACFGTGIVGKFWLQFILGKRQEVVGQIPRCIPACRRLLTAFCVPCDLGFQGPSAKMQAKERTRGGRNDRIPHSCGRHPERQ